MTQLSSSCRSAIIVAIGRLEESLRRENPDWRELETLDAAGPLLATVERRMDLAEMLAAEPHYLARAKLIEALICLEPPKVAEPYVEAVTIPEPATVTAPPATAAPEPPASIPAPAVPLAARITRLDALAPADDLTRIRGIDAVTAARLAAVGVQTFRDIASWTAADVARVNGLLDLGRRLHRENWIEQAALLAMPAPKSPLQAAAESVSPPPATAPESDIDFVSPSAAFEAPVAANNNEPAATPRDEDTETAIVIDDAANETMAVPADVVALPLCDVAATGPAVSPVADEVPEETGDADFLSGTRIDAGGEEAVIEIVLPASRAAAKPPRPARDSVAEPDVAPAALRQAHSPKAALTRLLEQRRIARATTSARRNESSGEELENDWALDVPEADVVVVVRKSALRSPPCVLPAADRDDGLQDAHSEDEAPAASEPPAGDWGREASVEIVNPRRPEHGTWRNPPPPPPPPASRFFKALKGE